MAGGFGEPPFIRIRHDLFRIGFGAIGSSQLDKLSGRQRGLSLLVIILCTGVFLAFAEELAPYDPDDAFISYRYADNLAKGNGLTFNAGEAPVEGYSNFAWIVLGAALSKNGMDLPRWMPRMSFLFGVLSLAVVWLVCLRRRLHPLQTLLPLLLLASFGPVVFYASSGMETSFFMFWLLVIVASLDSVIAKGALRDYLVLTLACILLFLTRPEGALVFPVVAVMIFFFGRKQKIHNSSKKNLLIASAIFVLAFVIYNAWRVQYFDDLLPTPLLSKGGGGLGLFHAWSINKSIYFVRQGNSAHAVPPFGYYYLALLLIAFVGICCSRPKTAEKLTASIATILVVIFSLLYVNFIDWMPGMRYHAALVGLLLVPIVQSLNPLFGENFLADKQKFRDWTYRYGSAGMIIFLISLPSSIQLKIEAQSNQRLNANLLAIADWANDVLPTDALIGTSDVGIVPYYSKLRTFDMHPQALVDRYVAENGVSSEYFFEKSPDLVMFHNRGVYRARMRPEYRDLVNDLRFTSKYRFLGVSRLDWHEDLSYWIYVKRGLQLTDEQMARFPYGLGDMRHRHTPEPPPALGRTR